MSLLRVGATGELPRIVWTGLVAEPFLATGALFVAPELMFWPIAADAQGSIDLPIAIPAEYPGSVPAFAQFASYDAARGTLSASGACVLIGRY